jgi:drug/metabolite transporter (DMT)-like permease
MKKQSSLFGSFQILSAALLWSTAGICVKLIPWGSFSIACIRGIICASVLFSMRFYRRKTGRGYAPVRFSRQNILAGAAMFLTGTMFMMSNKLTTAANAIVLQYIAPILVLLYTVLVEKRRPTAWDVLLTMTVFLGCVLAFSDQLSSDGVLGNILALISGFTFAAMIVLNRREGTVPEDGQIIGCGMTFFCCLPFAFTDNSFVVTPVSVGAMLFLGLFQYSLGNILFARGVKKTEPTAASIILTMEPIMSPVWVFLVKGEAPGLNGILGLALVVAAVTLHSLLPYLRKRRTESVAPQV